MPAKTAPKATAATATRKGRGATVALPATVSGSEAEWRGSSRGGGAANAALRESLKVDIAGMSLGSTRRYEITGKAQHVAFANLFRSVCDSVHNKQFGVQVATPQGDDGPIFVKLGARRANNK
jgi:hypothetical protein